MTSRPHATGHQPSVCITGSLRWVGGGHAECDGSGLHGLPEAALFLDSPSYVRTEVVVNVMPRCRSPVNHVPT